MSPEPASPLPPETNRDLTIEPVGRIHIGYEMNLLQAPAAAAAAGGFRFLATRPADGVSAVDDVTSFARAGELPSQQLEYSLVPIPDDSAYIKDAGLTTSYGIFGAPRAGKTHLLLYLLRQIFALHADDAGLKFGALILDPKAAMIEDVREAVQKAGREADLVVLNTGELERLDQSVNVIDCAIDPFELGRMLVLAAQSAGTGASEPFWFGAWTNLFGAAVYLMQWLDPQVLTLQRLLDAVLITEPGADGQPRREIQRLADDARQRLVSLPGDQQRDARQAISQVEGFYRQEPDNIATVESLITQAYAGFQQSRWSRYSADALKIPGERRTSFYDQIVDDGKIVLVSVSPSDPGMAKVLCTLVKCLFQMTVVGRLARYRAGTLRNFKRPLVLAVDEYSEVASEVPGQPMGDGYFFSVCRQNGCMGLVATQSVNVLQASSLKENWKAVFSNLGAKFFMRLADNETIEEATKLVGETDWYLTSLGTSRQKDGAGSSTQKELKERKLPASVFTDVLGRRQAMIIGSLNGGETQDVRFVRVPDNKEQKDAIKHTEKKMLKDAEQAAAKAAEKAEKKEEKKKKTKDNAGADTNGDEHA